MKIKISGFVTKPKYSHRTNIDFFEFYIRSHRTSGVADITRCIAAEEIVKKIKGYEKVSLSGEIRTRNYRGKLIVYVFVKSVSKYENETDENMVEMDGFICKEPVYRETHLGREITDLLIAVNRPSGKSDYIPCICWGRNARFADGLEIGTHIKICGRIQSREYVKKISENETENKIAYEVSASKIEVLEWEG